MLFNPPWQPCCWCDGGAGLVKLQLTAPSTSYQLYLPNYYHQVSGGMTAAAAETAAEAEAAAALGAAEERESIFV